MSKYLLSAFCIAAAIAGVVAWAGDLNISMSASVNKNGTEENWSHSANPTLSNQYVYSAVLQVTNVNEQISFGDVSTIGHVYIQNLSCSATNYLEIGFNGTEYPWKLFSNEWCSARWQTNAVHVRSKYDEVTIYRIRATSE